MKNNFGSSLELIEYKDEKQEIEYNNDIIWDTKQVNQLLEKIKRRESIKGPTPFFEGKNDLRKGNILFELTPTEIEEFIRCKNDVLYYAEHYCFITNSGKVFKIPLRDYQKRILKALQEEDMNIILSSRQSGKTTIIAIFMSWYMNFHNNRFCLTTAHKEMGMYQTLRNIHLLYEKLPFFLKPGIIQKAIKSMSYDNASHIQGSTTTADSGRSFPVNLLFTDEFAFVKESIAEEFYTSLLPTLSGQDNFKFIIASTVNGYNQFAKIFIAAKKKENSFIPHQVDWWEVPGRDEAWKNNMIRNLGSVAAFEQEYGNKIYNESDGSVEIYDQRFLTKIKTKFISSTDPSLYRNVNNDWLQYLKFNPNIPFDKFDNDYKLVISIDFADGIGKDYTVASIFRISPMSPAQLKNPKMVIDDEYSFFGLQQLGIWRSNIIDLDKFGEGLTDFLYKYLDQQNVILVVEVNDFRWQVVNNVLKSNSKYKECIYMRTKHSATKKPPKIGVRIDRGNKKIYFNTLKRYISNKKIKIYEENTIDELISFGINEKGEYVSGTGNDDICMSILNTIPMFENEIFHEMVTEIFEESYRQSYGVDPNKLLKKIREEDPQGFFYSDLLKELNQK